MKAQYMLDTNTVSFLVRGNSDIRAKVTGLPIGSCCISVITEAELRFGLVKRPEATQLSRLVHELLFRLPSLKWDSKAAQSHAGLRALAEKHGLTISNMDMLIAAHAYATSLPLITHDAIFSRLASFDSRMAVEDWTSSSRL